MNLDPKAMMAAAMLDMGLTPSSLEEGVKSPQTEHLADEYFVTAPYVVYRSDGRLWGSGRQPVAGTQQQRLNGDLVMLGLGEPDTHYVDMTDGIHTLRERPALLLPELPESVAVGATITVPNAPAGPVRYAGPVTGVHQHEGGNLVIGFSVPGEYTVSVDTLPCRPFSISIRVTP